MLEEEIPDLLVFKPTSIPDPDSLAKEISIDAKN
jgi:hypothetical protein